MTIRSLALAASTAVVLASTPAAAATLVVGGGWTAFSFGDVGSSWDDSFDFTVAQNVEVHVVDAFLSGDQFEVFSNGSSVGLTSLPLSVGDQIGSDYDAAFADPRWSSGSFFFGPGSYTITGLTTLSPFSGGGGAIRLARSTGAAVPEPMTWSLMVIGFGLIGFGLRSKRRKVRTTVSYA